MIRNLLDNWRSTTKIWSASDRLIEHKWTANVALWKISIIFEYLSYEKCKTKSEHLILCSVLYDNLIGPYEKKMFFTIQVKENRRKFVYGLR